MITILQNLSKDNCTDLKPWKKEKGRKQLRLLFYQKLHTCKGGYSRLAIASLTDLPAVRLTNETRNRRIKVRINPLSKTPAFKIKITTVKLLSAMPLSTMRKENKFFTTIILRHILRANVRSPFADQRDIFFKTKNLPD
jgi:hypothetical protein